MASSKDNLYQRPNLAIDGVMPDYFRRPDLPSWATSPNLRATPPRWPAPLSSPPPGPGFPDPPPTQRAPQPHDVDPPAENPYNDPDYNPNFLVTKTLPDREQRAPRNWLLAYFDQLGNCPVEGDLGNTMVSSRSAGGLLGRLYEVTQGSAQQP
jgi:hypothetical protein